MAEKTHAIRRGKLYLWMRRRSTIAVMMCFPLLAIITCLVAYPFAYSIYLSEPHWQYIHSLEHRQQHTESAQQIGWS